MRKRRVPLPCAQEIAALRRKRVQPSFSDCKEARAGHVSLPADLRGTHDPNTSSGGIEVRFWSFRVFFRIASVDCPEKSAASLIRQKAKSQIFHHVLNFD